jgi:fructokinase
MDEASRDARLAGIELGGTKAIAALAEGGTIVEVRVVPTGAPRETLGELNSILREWDRRAGLDALGIASFGPIDLNRGSVEHATILDTPKDGWAGAKVGAALTAGLRCPWSIDTDVNAAALAEFRRGSAVGCASVCYVTVGTGVGGGLVIEGRPVHGALHPELGHIRLRRAEGDRFAGICRFHADCVEGLVSGPAIAARFAEQAEMIPDEHPGWAHVAFDLGQLAASIFLTTSAERIVLGGSIPLGRPFLLPLMRARALEALMGYLRYLDSHTIEQAIVLSCLGAEAGPVGAITLAEEALHQAGREYFFFGPRSRTCC